MCVFIDRGPSPVSAEEKVSRINFWFKWYYDHTSSFEGRIGEDLTYLFGAIADDSCCAFREEESPLLELLALHRNELTDARYREIKGYIEIDFDGTAPGLPN